MDYKENISNGQLGHNRKNYLILNWGEQNIEKKDCLGIVTDNLNFWGCEGVKPV